MVGVGQKYVLGLVALVLWPFGWVIAAVVTNAMLEAAATANLVPVFVAGAPIAAPALTVLLIGTWMLVSSLLAPWITTKIFLMGANPAAALAQGVGGVAQAVVTGGAAAAVAAATGGAATGGIVLSAAGGALAGGTESAVRGGGSPRTTSTVIGGVSGFYTGGLMRRHAKASESAAAAQRQSADASEEFASVFTEYASRQRRTRSNFDKQPHNEDPNNAAIEIESHDKSKS
jgi:type IV secretion system protein TrbL